MPIAIASLLSAIPESLRNELVQALNEIERNFKESRWEPSELNGGNLCEVVYSILKGYVDNNYPSSASKPRNMVDACKDLEQTPSTFLGRFAFKFQECSLHYMK